MPHIRYRTVDVGGHAIFYREAGDSGLYALGAVQVYRSAARPHA